MRARSISKNAVWVLLVRGTQIFSGIFTTAVISRSLSLENFGIYNEIYAVLGILTPLALPGFANVIYQSVARSEHHHVKPALRLMFRTSLAGSLGIALYSIYAYFRHGNDAFVSALVIALLFPLTHGLDSWKGLHIGGEDYKELGISGVTNTIGRAVLVVGASLVFPGSIWAIVVAGTIPVAIQNSIRSKRIFRQMPESEELDGAKIKYGYKSTLFIWLGALSSNADKIMLSHFLSPSALAIYSASEKASDLAKMWMTDWAALYSAKFARRKHYTKALAKLMDRNYLISSLAFLAVALLAAPFAIIVLYGEKFQDATIISQISLITLGVCSRSFFENRFLQSQHDTEALKRTTVHPIYIRVLSSACLIPFFGLWGAVGSLALFRISSAISSHLAVRGLHKSKLLAADAKISN